MNQEKGKTNEEETSTQENKKGETRKGGKQ